MQIAMYEFFVSLKFYKYFKEKSIPFSFCFDACLPDHYHATRFNNHCNLNIHQINVAKYQSSFVYNAIKFWNSLDVNVKEINSFVHFKNSIRKVYLNKINSD